MSQITLGTDSRPTVRNPGISLRAVYGMTLQECPFFDLNGYCREGRLSAESTETELLDMRDLWQEIRAHKLAAIIYLFFWIGILVAEVITFDRNVAAPVIPLLFIIPLFAGGMVGWWRKATRERAARMRNWLWGGTLVGVLSSEITFIVMEGGAADELIGWMQGRRFQGVEVLEFLIATGIVGALLGPCGAAFARALNGNRRMPISPA